MPVAGRGIGDIPPSVKFFHAAGISGFGTDAGLFHQFLPEYGERVAETVQVPLVKQGHVQAQVIG